MALTTWSPPPVAVQFLRGLSVLIIVQHLQGNSVLDAAPTTVANPKSQIQNGKASEPQSSYKTDRLAKLADPSSAERLRQMFLQSQLQAIQDYHEQSALKRLTSGHGTSSSPESIIQQHMQPADHTIHVIPLAALGGDSSQHLLAKELHQQNESATPAHFVFYQNLQEHVSNGTPGGNSNTNRTQSDTDESDDDKNDSKLAKLIHHDANFKNDARQSSLFPNLMTPNFGNAFGAGGLGGINPLLPGGGLLGARPAFPSLGGLPQFRLPTFPQQQKQLPRAPKTSVIGNSGGPMALTNDNVVVVNVLSGNY